MICKSAEAVEEHVLNFNLIAIHDLLFVKTLKIVSVLLKKSGSSISNLILMQNKFSRCCYHLELLRPAKTFSAAVKPDLSLLFGLTSKV